MIRNELLARPVLTRMTLDGQTSFGRTLRAQREARSLGLRQLAISSGLSPSYLSRLEHDHSPPPRAAVLRRLARSLDMDVETLLGAAGIIPDFVISLVRSRPKAMQTLLTLIAPMTDDEVGELCDEIQRRLAKLPAARLQAPRIDNETFDIESSAPVR